MLSRINNPNKLRFRNIIDILDFEAFQKSNARYLILNKNLISEMFPGKTKEQGEVDGLVFYLYREFEELYHL